MHPYQSVALVWKRIPDFANWSEPEAETGYSWFDVPLEMAGVTEAGFVFHGGCLIDRPDCHVTFELRVAKRPGRSCVPLSRVCWRSLNGGHSNQPRWGTEWAGARVGPTHYHGFSLNWHEQRQRMKGQDLPVAMPINESLDSYEELMKFTKNALRISNIDIVPRPRWVYKLL